LTSAADIRPRMGNVCSGSWSGRKTPGAKVAVKRSESPERGNPEFSDFTLH
jgi:hypothetical protein